MSEDKYQINTNNYEYTKPRVPIAAMYASPGPIYMVPSLVGHPNHDTRSTHVRGPAYSLAARTGLSDKDKSPGPAAYKPPEGFTNFGPDSTPKYSMAGLNTEITGFQAPGPGTYDPRKATNFYPRQPDYSFGTKHKELSKSDIPAPNAYKLPSADITADKKAAPHYSMAKRPDTLFGSSDAPGPGTYKSVDPDIHMSAAPKYSMGTTAVPPRGSHQNPGPGTYRNELVKVHLPGSAGYSFGIKHSEYAGHQAERYQSFEANDTTQG